MIDAYLNLIHQGQRMEALFHKSYPESISKHLTTDEFGCRCNSICDANLIDTKLVGAFEATRADFMSPIIVTSGFRCTYHNYTEGGKERSKHTRGLAVDITSEELTRLETVARRYFDKVIVYKEKNFIHCSMNP